MTTTHLPLAFAPALLLISALSAASLGAATSSVPARGSVARPAAATDTPPSAAAPDATSVATPASASVASPTSGLADLSAFEAVFDGRFDGILADAEGALLDDAAGARSSDPVLDLEGVVLVASSGSTSVRARVSATGQATLEVVGADGALLARLRAVARPERLAELRDALAAADLSPSVDVDASAPACTLVVQAGGRERVVAGAAWAALGLERVRAAAAGIFLDAAEDEVR